jgi:hypothetical protein
MLLWIWLIGGVALAAAVVGLIVAVSQAERRARRTLFRALGLDEETVELLMARNGDVLAELALVRRQDLAALSGAEPAEPEPAAGRTQLSIRLVHPAGPAAVVTPPADAARPAASRRRLQLPGRRSRP